MDPKTSFNHERAGVSDLKGVGAMASGEERQTRTRSTMLKSIALESFLVSDEGSQQSTKVKIGGRLRKRNHGVWSRGHWLLEERGELSANVRGVLYDKTRSRGEYRAYSKREGVGAGREAPHAIGRVKFEVFVFTGWEVVG